MAVRRTVMPSSRTTPQMMQDAKRTNPVLSRARDARATLMPVTRESGDISDSPLPASRVWTGLAHLAMDSVVRARNYLSKRALHRVLSFSLSTGSEDLLCSPPH